MVRLRSHGAKATRSCLISSPFGCSRRTDQLNGDLVCVLATWLSGRQSSSWGRQIGPSSAWHHCSGRPPSTSERCNMRFASVSANAAAFIKARRLTLARSELVRAASGETTGGAVMAKVGVSHVGQFACDSRRSFQELPSETPDRRSLVGEGNLSQTPIVLSVLAGLRCVSHYGFASLPTQEFSHDP